MTLPAHLGTKNANFGKPISDNIRNAIIESNKRRALKKNKHGNPTTP